MTVHVPPPVPGDPAGMRALAARLRWAGDAFADQSAAASRGLAELVFEGPAAVRFRGYLGDWSARMTARALRLHDLADTVLRAASQVEDAQTERARLIRLQAQQEAEARRAQGGAR